MKKIFIAIMSLVTVVCNAQDKQPVGWASCESLDGGTYVMHGGDIDGGTKTVIKSNGGDMYQTLFDAIKTYNTVVIDGSNGPFTVSRQMEFHNLQHKTIVGINGARIETQFYMTDDIRHMLDTANVKQYSTSGVKGKFYTLSNGKKVKEECEYQVRQHLIDYLNDPRENFQNAGIFSLSQCEDIIIRNLVLQGPGSVDVSGKDLLTIGHHSNHIWVDHCDFIDGIDGNFDISSFSDFVTVSWCTFSYTQRAYVHMNTNLIGSNDNPQFNGEDNLNVTYHNCIWGKGCDQRMPMVRFGKIHLLNCMYECAGCTRTVNPRYNSEVLMEGCVWKKGVKHIFAAKDPKAYQWRDCIFEEEYTPEDFGTVTMPYKYKALSAKKVEKTLRGKHGAGATL